MGPKLVLPLQIRVDLGVMEMKEYYTFPKLQEWSLTIRWFCVLFVCEAVSYLSAEIQSVYSTAITDCKDIRVVVGRRCHMSYIEDFLFSRNFTSLDWSRKAIIFSHENTERVFVSEMLWSGWWRLTHMVLLFYPLRRGWPTMIAEKWGIRSRLSVWLISKAIV